MPAMRSVALGIWVDVGSRDERPSIAGSSHFLEHLLFKGTKTRTARQIAEAFDAVGGDLNAFSAKEYTTYHCRVLDRDLPMAVDHMSDMLQHSLVSAAAGNVKHEAVCELVERGVDTGPRVSPERAAARTVRSGGHAPVASGSSLVKRRRTEQAHLCLGTNGLSRRDPDRFAFGVVNVA